jgi:hypothetical protein
MDMRAIVRTLSSLGFVWRAAKLFEFCVAASALCRAFRPSRDAAPLGRACRRAFAGRLLVCLPVYRL